MKYVAFHASNALGVYTEDEHGERMLEQAEKYLKNAKYKSFSNLEEAMEYAIEGYNDRQDEPWAICCDEKLKINWTKYKKAIINEYYSNRG